MTLSKVTLTPLPSAITQSHTYLVKQGKQVRMYLQFATPTDSGITSGVEIYNVPIGYRPPESLYAPCAMIAAGGITMTYVDVSSSGKIAQNVTSSCKQVLAIMEWTTS